MYNLQGFWQTLLFENINFSYWSMFSVKLAIFDKMIFHSNKK